MKRILKNKKRVLGFITLGGVLSIALFLFFNTGLLNSYIEFNNERESIVKVKKVEFEASHIKTPEQLKGVYMTSWVAGTKSIRDGLISLIEDTEINAIVIDIKDYSGKIAFKVQDENLLKYDSVENRMPDIKELIEYLHSKNVYVIGRISVFQDPHLVEKRPDLAVKKSEGGEVWTDYKGISWLDAGSTEVWDYVITLAKESHNIGFDEINFDYIRFPSDGNMNEIYYPISEERIILDPDNGKAKVLQEFFSYLYNKMSETGAILSADLFGMVTTNSDDLNIGQILEYALPFFDYICPMVYPSHYPTGFIGLTNPAEHPYEVIKYSMDKAVEKTINASSSPDKIRPWLQDFDLGADYTAPMVRKQIQATYDSGLDSWLLWSASNRYTKDALLKK
ncbi:MAG: putative glycoside hydrolase [Candidatus Pacebacteria bacterium]|nr:putative glycoside hydrolase [Candidatus Paceibacterota bacterium]